MMKKDIVVGLGEIGNPILKLLSINQQVIGFDKDKKLMNKLKYKKFQDVSTSFCLHSLDRLSVSPILSSQTAGPNDQMPTTVNLPQSNDVLCARQHQEECHPILYHLSLPAWQPV